MSGSSGTMLIQLSNQTTITSFTTTTILSTSTVVDSYQISPPSKFTTQNVPPSTMIDTTTIVSSPQHSTASRSMSKVRDPSDALYADGDKRPAPFLDLSTTTAIALNDASPDGCQEIIISIIIQPTPPTSPSTAYPEGTSPNDYQPNHQSTLYFPQAKNPLKDILRWPQLMGQQTHLLLS